MEKKVFGVFSGRQLTVLALGAMFVPGALYAVPAFTNVAIEDPMTGARASVDPERRLHVFDPLLAFQHNPANLVRILALATQPCGVSFRLPADKAMIVTSTTTVFSGAGVEVDLFSGTQRRPCTDLIGGATSNVPTQTVTQTLGNGAVVPAGSVLSAEISLASAGPAAIVVYGYLVPAEAVPAAGTAEAAAQSIGPKGVGMLRAGR